MIEIKQVSGSGVGAAAVTPLTLDHPDGDRARKEAHLRSLGEADLRKLYDHTRAAAAAARRADDMEGLYRLVRGTKTIQRIAGERGILIMAPRR